MKRNFLVVAANPRVREALAGDLRAKGYSVTCAVSGKEAERVVQDTAVDAVLTESQLPDLTGDELVARVRKVRPDCRTLILTNFEQVRTAADQLRFGADDYLLRGSEIVELLHAPYLATREEATQRHGRRGVDALVQVMDVLVGLLELDERFFGGFSHQVMELSRAVAEELSEEDDTVLEVVIATLLRDVGKAGVDAEVLTAQGPYSEDQRQRMNAHVDGSVRLFEHIDFPWKVLPIVRHHHERYDGEGHPDGLRGREIPLGARIVSVVDAYVALTSGRSHRGAFDSEQALTMLISESGRQFDPEVLEAFQGVLDKRRNGRKRHRKPRILIADGNAEARRLLKMRLLNEGHDVIDVPSCERAMEHLLKDPPDLVIADVDTDVLAAFQFLEELRAEEPLRRVPVALISGSSDRVLRIRALRQGVDEFLNKNDDLEELMARVGNVLTREAIRKGNRPRRVRRGITGDLENLGLDEIVQTLAMGMKTACITLRSGGHEGRIWFDRGNATHAEFGEQKGEEAFYRMVGWNQGEFVIEHGIRSEDSSLTQDAMYLLMEGLRRLDEARDRDAQAAS